MRHRLRRLFQTQAGSAVHEFALTAPVLMLIMVGAIDFGRSFYHSIAISNAAGTAAFFGSQSIMKSGHSTDMTTLARNDAADIGTVTVSSARVCRCPDGASVRCVSGTCRGYGSPRVYVRCDVSRIFDTMINLSKVPDLFTIRRQVWMRVQ